MFLVPAFSPSCPEIEDDFNPAEGEKTHSTVIAHSTVSDDLIKRVAAIVDKDTPRLQNIFKDIHKHPELGFMETRTAKIVAIELKKLGYKVTTGIGIAGVSEKMIHCL